MSTTTGRDPHEQRGERCLFWFLALTPLWWATGTLVPLAILGTIVLFVLRPPRDPAVATVVGLWITVGAAQMLSGVINWSLAGEPWSLLPKRLVSIVALGWILLGLCIGVGAEYRLASARIVRGICIQATQILVLSVFAYATAYGLSLSELSIPSPLAFVLPDMPTVQQYFTMRFFLTEDFSASQTVRLVLFYPWSTGLALAGITAMLLCHSEPNRLLRVAAFSGGAAGLILSFSRASMVALLLTIAVVAFYRLPRVILLAALMVFGLAVNLALLTGWDPVLGIDAFYDAFTKTREGSSQARQMIYDASYAAFLNSPILGHGWVGENYSRYIPVGVGTHSSFYGVLYTGGLLTFGALCIAYAATLVFVAVRWTRPGVPIALALLLALGLVSYGEGMYSLVPSLIATFAWIGGVVAPPFEMRASSRGDGLIVERRT